MSIGEKIKIARKEKGLTQKNLAKMIGVTHQAISRWEHDTSLPDILTLDNLCEILEKDIYYFLNKR